MDCVVWKTYIDEERDNYFTVEYHGDLSNPLRHACCSVGCLVQHAEDREESFYNKTFDAYDG